MDMFVTQTNRKCTRYTSRAGRDEDLLGDAFMIPWESGLLYLFPPILRIQKTRVRAHQLKSDAIFIVPW